MQKEMMQVQDVLVQKYVDQIVTQFGSK